MAEHDSIRGLHHVTAIAGSAQANLDFYTGVLGLRLVKRTVNFDAPDTYHFYPGFPGWPALCWRESAKFGLISSSLRHLRWWLHGTPSG